MGPLPLTLGDNVYESQHAVEYLLLFVVLSKTNHDIKTYLASETNQTYMIGGRALVV